MIRALQEELDRVFAIVSEQEKKANRPLMTKMEVVRGKFLLLKVICSPKSKEKI
jgi:hypothetical protein